jgi:hypothetical protein
MKARAEEADGRRSSGEGHREKTSRRRLRRRPDRKRLATKARAEEAGDEGSGGRDSAEKALQRCPNAEVPRRRSADEGSNPRAERVRRRLGFAKKTSGRREPLALMILALYRQVEIYK